MKYHNITFPDMNNGEGLRVVLWVAGCPHHCKGCQNPCTWDENDGIDFTEETKKEVFGYLSEDYIQGITFSGGDPLHPKNRDTTGSLISEIKIQFPKKDIWLYTGYTWDEIVGMDLPCLKDIDVLIDGKYIEEQRDISLMWRGSKNQRVINVNRTLAEGRIVLQCDL